MPNQSRFAEYKWLLLLPAAVFLYFAFGFLLRLLDRELLGPQPDVILTAIHGARTAPAIVRRTGPVDDSRYTLRKDRHSIDSLLVQIQVSGERADAHINLHATRATSGAWRIYQSDTTFTTPK